MVVMGVDEGDMEALKVKEFGKFHHGIDVALCWIGDTNGMWLFHCCNNVSFCLPFSEGEGKGFCWNL